MLKLLNVEMKDCKCKQNYIFQMTWAQFGHICYGIWMLFFPKIFPFNNVNTTIVFLLTETNFEICASQMIHDCIIVCP